MSAKIFTIVALIVVVLAGGLFFFGSGEKEIGDSEEIGEEPGEKHAAFAFGNPKKSAHYESNTPTHGAVLAAVPINVVIDFNFDLAPPSSISITSGDKEYGAKDTQIDSNKLTMRRAMDPQAPDGLYAVSYRACWPDKSCHEGGFKFAIDRSRAASYMDFRNQREVTIKMSNIAFAPAQILISPGTKVIWRNDDAVEHYINTDAHPSHTYFPNQNSRELNQGDMYEAIFEKAGVYPYHCSAHADAMKANIIVE
jgi:plastocyanin